MRSIYALFIRNGGFLTFMLMEVVAFFLVVSINERQKAVFLHSVGLFGENIQQRYNWVAKFFGMAERMDKMQRENQRLNTQLINAGYFQIPRRDTARATITIDSLLKDTTLRFTYIRPSYEYIPAEIISNTINSNSNWIMINRGSLDGVRENTGVVTPSGVVGIVRYVDRRFSMVMSALHRQTRISATLGRRGYFGSLLWDGKDPSMMLLTDIPRHVPMIPGDTVRTSGFSSIFPRGLMIGTAQDSLPPENGSYFYSIRVKLSQDLSNANEVQVVSNLFKDEIDRLQQRVKDEQ